MQYRKFDTRKIGRRREGEAGGFDTHRRPVVRVELPELDEDRAAGLGAGCVAAGRRIADIGAGGIVAMLVLEDAVEHQELLAAAMGVRREMAVRGVADDRGGARHLVPDAVEHAAVHAWDRRRRPVQPGRMHRRASAEIRVEVHV